MLKNKIAVIGVGTAPHGNFPQLPEFAPVPLLVGPPGIRAPGTPPNRLNALSRAPGRRFVCPLAVTGAWSSSRRRPRC